MFLTFYQLAEPPFGVTSDPRFLYLGSTHREALASVLHGLHTGRGFAALIAGAGMGKTALLRLMVQKLQGSTRTAFLSQSRCSSRELLMSLLVSLGIEGGSESFSAMHAKLNDTLLREYNTQKRFVVIIDEAQDLAEPTLELLRVLSNVETPREKLMHFILSGHPQLAEKLASPRLTQLRQRVSIIARLQPFDAEQTRQYIDHRLRIAGYDFARPLFTPSALDLIICNTSGVPRNINNVCFNALSLGFVHKQQTIDADIIQEVLEDLDLQKLIEAGGEVPFIPRSRLGDHDALEVPMDPKSSDENSPSSNVAQGASMIVNEVDEPQQHLHAEVASLVGSLHVSRSPQDADLRRSSRIDHPVSLIVLGTNRAGESFQEETSAVSLNLHGCRYPSRHDYPLGGWVTLQVGGEKGANSIPIRARVRSVFSSKSPLEFCQVGVELETPANVWGVAAPPGDWRSNIPSDKCADHTATEVTGSQLLSPVNEIPADREPDASINGNAALTLAKLLPDLHDRLQETVDRFAQTAVESRLDESLRSALTRIDHFWKANASQSEEFYTARLAETRQRLEEDLTVHRSRTEEASRRLENLAAKARQGLLELQKFVTQIKSEIEPQFNASLNQSLLRAASEFETIATRVSERHCAGLDRTNQETMRQTRSQLDETIAEMRSSLATSPVGIPEERLESVIGSSKESILKHIGECLADVYRQFDQQQELARHRGSEFSQQLEKLTASLQETRVQNDQAIAEVRAFLVSRDPGVSRELFDSVMHSEREQIFKQLECHLSEVSALSDQQHDLGRQRTAEIAQQLENLVAKTRDMAAQQEQSVAELDSRLADVTSSSSQERLDGLLEIAREQFFNHLETRIGEISGSAEQRQEVARQQFEEISRRLDQLVIRTQTQMLETRELAERAPRDLLPQNRSDIQASANRAVQEFENSAARVSDRQLVRMMEQKQAVARELSLDLEARASETRALVEKSANSAIEEFQRHLELQSELMIAEATQRVTSSLASLDAEYRTARDTHHQTLETEVAHAAEQSMTEFRSGMKAFLYSCLVAAVSAVDQHAQTTLGGLSNDPVNSSLKLDAVSDPSAEYRSPSPNSSSS